MFETKEREWPHPALIPHPAPLPPPLHLPSHIPLHQSPNPVQNRKRKTRQEINADYRQKRKEDIERYTQIFGEKKGKLQSLQRIHERRRGEKATE